MKILLRIITGCLAGWLWIALPAVSMATEASRPIQAEVIITEFPRFLAKQATDTPVVLQPIKVAQNGRYGAQVKFIGCTPDSTGKCKAQVLYVLLDPKGQHSFTSKWLRLWDDRPPPPIGEPRIGEEGMGGIMQERDTTGSWEVIAVIRDQVSGLMSSSSASFIVPAPLLSTAPVRNTFCHVDEAVLFSCSTEAKQISLCASPDVLQKSGYIAYRFGRPNQLPEIDFHPPNQKTIDTFSYLSSGYAKGSTTLLQFAVGEFTYQVFSEQNVFDWSGAGVVVNRDKKRVAYLLCSDKSVVNNLHRLEPLGLHGGDSVDFFLEHRPAN